MIVAERMPRAISWRRTRRCGGEPRQVFSRAWRKRTEVSELARCACVRYASLDTNSGTHEDPGVRKTGAGKWKRKKCGHEGKRLHGHEQAYVR